MAPMITAETTVHPAHRSQFVSNPNLKDLQTDNLYHINLTTDNLDEIKQKFGDVKFVCLAGSVSRVQKFAKMCYEKLKDIYDIPDEAATDDIAYQAGRYSAFKIGPVLTVNHGMGAPSTSILMHELLKLLHYAEATNVKFLRMGTCGGLGVKPGTLILTKSGFDGCLEKGIEIVALGQKKRYQADADPIFLSELTKTLEEMEIPFEIGNTMTCNDFYETQGRLDGAFCEYSNDDKLSFIQKAHDEFGIKNIEMEASLFLAMCNRANVSCAVACVALLNRLDGDQVRATPDLKKYENAPLEMIIQMIRNQRLEEIQN
jgi:uridine phosphorylase